MSEGSNLPLSPLCLPFLGVGQRVLVGLSGGRDSVALLLRLREEGCCVVARHVHHGLRGADADADARFCADLCARLGIDFACLQADVPRLATQHACSFELMARKVRRDYFIKEARAAGTGVIALAQHADDQAETVLFRLGRGSSALRGMHEAVEQDGLTWLRPLLLCRRVAIDAYLEGLGQGWREDASNADCAYTRNALRHRLIPAFSAAMGRDVVPIINRTAALQAEIRLALDEALVLLDSHFYDPQGRLFAPALRAVRPALARAVIHRYLQQSQLPDISSDLVGAIYGLLDAAQAVSRVNLPGGGYLRRAHQRLFIED